MADIDDRAQLILVGGLAIAVAIVVLVVLLNAAIYSQNLATRSVDAGDQEALDFRNAMADGVAGLLAEENERPITPRSELGDDVTSGVDNISAAIERQHAVGGVHADLTSYTLHGGTSLVQDNGTRELTSAGGAANWTLATDTPDVRSYVIDLNEDGMVQTNLPGKNATRVVLEGASNEWHLYVYEDLDGNDRISVKNGTGTTAEDVCTGLLDDGVTINLTAGTVDGSSCPAIEFGKGVSAPYDLRYAFGNHSEGAYNLTVNTTVDDGDFNGPVSTTSPYEAPVIYSATLELVYEAPDLLYRTRVRVTPGGSNV